MYIPPPRSVLRRGTSLTFPKSGDKAVDAVEDIAAEMTLCSPTKEVAERKAGRWRSEEDKVRSRAYRCLNTSAAGYV